MFVSDPASTGQQTEHEERSKYRTRPAHWPRYHDLWPRTGRHETRRDLVTSEVTLVSWRHDALSEMLQNTSKL